MCSQDWLVLRLRITAEADPGALARILHPFQNLNILPRKVLAELSTRDVFHVELDIGGLTEDTVRLIAAKLRESPTILYAQWHRLP
jgi:hypothetical protein